jgi:ankyrin repeat protein
VLDPGVGYVRIPCRSREVASMRWTGAWLLVELLHLGASLGCQQGPTAKERDLARAARLGDRPAVTQLLAEGVNPNRYDPRYYSPLEAAVCANDFEIVKALVEHGARADIGRPGPLYYAARDNQIEIAKYLLDYGSDARSAINAASREGHVDMIELLLSRIERVASLDSASSPIFAAASYGGAEVIRVLHAKGLRVDVTDGAGWTPLHKAAWVGAAEAVSVLLACGANRDAKTSEGETPLSLAKKGGHADVVRILEAKNRWD